MADYYSDKLKAFIMLDKMLKRALQDNVTVSVDKLLYELTGQYAVSEAALKKRIKQFEKHNNNTSIEWND